MRCAGEASSSPLIATLLTAFLRLPISSSLTLPIRRTYSPLHSRQCLAVICPASSCTNRAFASPPTRPATSSFSGLQLRRISCQRQPPRLR
ncbi:hypothetical protein C8R44DRAFT_822054, partial [Mycena epipterygia]